MRPPIKTKRQMYTLLRSGALGNTLRTWRSSDDIAADGYEGEIALRMSTGSSGHFITGIDMRSSIQLGNTLARADINITDVVFCEPFPDDQLVLQGEVMDAPFGLVLAWSDVPRLNMRQAASRGFQHTFGLAAKTLLRARLSDSSYDDLMELLELYPEHVVEFSAAESFVGNRPGRNAVIWECRAY